MQTRASRKRRLEGNEILPLVSKSFDWNQLPIELWLEICKYLPFMELFQLRRVNKIFNRAIDSCISLRDHLTISFLRRYGLLCKFSNNMIEHIFSPPNRWQALKVLNIEGAFSSLVSTSLAKISKNAKNLEDITISCDGIKRMHFRSFIKAYPRLRRFSLTANGGSLSLDSLKTLFKNCQLLTRLSLSFRDCRFEFNEVDVSDPVVASKLLFPNRSPYLEDLHLYLPELDLMERLDPLITATFSQSLVKLSNHALPDFPMPNLEDVTTGFVDLMEYTYVEDMDVQELLNFWYQFPKLRQLSLSRGARHFPQLCGMKIFTDIFALPNCPVRSLSFDFYFLDDLSALRGIERLHLGQCDGLWSVNLKIMLINNSSIKALTLCTLVDFCEDLLPFIGANCKQLEFLSIGENRRFNFTHLLAFAEAHSEAAGSSSIIKLSAPSKKDHFAFIYFILYFISLGLTDSIEAADYELLKIHGVFLNCPANRSSSRVSSPQTVVIPNARFTSDGSLRI